MPGPGQIVLAGGGTTGPSAATSVFAPQSLGVPAFQPLQGAGDNTVVIFGDSLTQDCQYQTAAGVIANRPRWFSIANALLGQRLTLINNAGYNGDFTSGINVAANPNALGMLARLNLAQYGVGFGQNGQEATGTLLYPGVLFNNPAIVFVLGGTNDIFSTNPPNSFSFITANLTTIYNQIRATGAFVVAMTIPPAYNTSSNYNNATVALLLAVNDWIRNYARTTPGIILVDAFAAMVNPTDSTYVQAPLTYYRDGAIHPNNVGGFAIAQKIVTALSGVIAPTLETLPTSNVATYANFGSTQLIDNPLLTGSAAIVASGWSGNGPGVNPPTYNTQGGATCVGSIAARADGYGNEFSVAVTTSNTGDGLYVLWPDVHARTVVGGTYYATMECAVTGPSGAALVTSNNFAGLQLCIQYNNGSQNYFNYDWYYNAGFDRPWGFGNFTVTLRTPPITINQGAATTFRMFLLSYGQGAGGHVIGIGRVGLIRSS